MKALLFAGAFDRNRHSVSEYLTSYLKEQLEMKGIETVIFKIAGSGIPLFDPTLLKKPPLAVQKMEILFQDADFHIWLTPLYHGSMTGAMKNCLDWLEISADNPIPYLTGKIVGLVCWADGVQALNGINAMDTVAKTLRAWPAPYGVAIQRENLLDENGELNMKYKERFQLLIQLLTWKC